MYKNSLHCRLGSDLTRQFFRAKRFRVMMHKGTFPRAAIRSRKRTLVHHRAEYIGALMDPARGSAHLYDMRTMSHDVNSWSAELIKSTFQYIGLPDSPNQPVLS